MPFLNFDTHKTNQKMFNEPINKQINKFNICFQEIEIENYHEVDVPEHLVQKFEQMDKFYLED